MNGCCATCRGACCKLGGQNHAFLTAHDVRRLRVRAPETTPEQAVTLYAERLPETSVEDSCVYHGPRGCRLRRDLRADICNSFHCVGQVALANALRERGPRPVIVVAQDGGAPRAVGLVDAQGGWAPVAEIAEPPPDAPEA